MLSLFLRAGGRSSRDPTSRIIADEGTELQAGAERRADYIETATPAGVEVPIGNLSALVADIIANAEFLEVVYGENQYLKNILHSAGEVKRHLQDA